MSASEPAGAGPRPATTHAVATLSNPPRAWTLRIFPAGVRLEPAEPGDEPVHVLRQDALERLDLVDFGLARRILTVRKPKKRTFKLDPAAWHDVREWLGYDARIRIALKRRTGFGIPMGLLFLLTSLPLPGDAQAGIVGIPASPLNAALGAALVASAILARRRPRPWLFLADSAWFAVLAASLVFAVAHGASRWWLLAALLQLQLVWSGIKLFREFSAARQP
jgi:hypothetical protein